ncbi:hypothetical protein POM88_036091 [Heracleum sosnowskyi]|uniref:Uncharacterized protein n=1 Tax=Heracleum sosnowskyi TaxID=360622 RepID=A0AAD8HMP7_9APIA|nr:hypothetical protein POM88_036091 [Heracleum sosnowskyi]
MWRRSLEKSIGRAFVESETTLITRCYSIRFNSFSNYHDYPQRKCDVEVEAKFQSVSDLGMIPPNATECWKQLKTQNIKYQKVTKGDVIDLRKFLFTNYRDYLIRYNDKTQVKAEQLAGKAPLDVIMSSRTKEKRYLLVLLKERW